MSKFISIEVMIPATGDPLVDNETMNAIKEPLAALKTVVHGLPTPGNVTVRHVGKKEKVEKTALVVVETPAVEVPVVVLERAPDEPEMIPRARPATLRQTAAE